MCQKLFYSSREKNIALLHQMVPIGAVRFLKKPPVELFSMSYVIFKNTVKILAQLFYYKCTSEPIHALLIDPNDKTIEVSKQF